MNGAPEFIPDEQFAPDATATANPAEAPKQSVAPQPIKAPEAKSPDFIPDSTFVSDEEKYGGVGQRAITALEGAGEAASFGLSTGLETALGVKPEDIRLRRETNPLSHIGGQVAGLAASALIPGVGEANILEHAGAAAASLGERALVKAALKGAAETALFQGGDEVSKYLSGTHESLGNVVQNVGLAALLGGGVGAGFSAVSPLWAMANESTVGQAIQSFKNRMVSAEADVIADAPLEQVSGGAANRLTKQKPNAKEISEIGAKNNWPVLEGMTSGSKEIQMAEDALLNGPPTLPAIARRKVYDEAYGAVTKDVKNVFGGEAISETQAGNLTKQSLLNKLQVENEPIKALYKEIEPYRQAIPVTERSTGSLARNVSKLIEEQGLIPGSDRFNFVKTMADGLENVDNLQKLKNFTTELWKSSGPMTKDLAGDIAERLAGVEERAIKRFADTMKTDAAYERINSLIEQSGQAKSMYKGFIEKLQTLGASLGKKKIYGPQNFMDFIEELNPQTLARRIFNENNTEFAQYFAKEFPEEMQIVKQYEKSQMGLGSTKEGIFNTKSALKKALELEPEMKEILFDKTELKKLNEAKTYIDSFPKDFNPSHTAHESAFRAFFEHPTGAIIGNARDVAIQGFIKAFGKVSKSANASELAPFMGRAVVAKDVNAAGFKNAVDYISASLKGEKNLSKAAKEIFKSGKIVIPSNGATDKLKTRVNDLSQNPDKLFEVSGQLAHYMPEHAGAMAKTVMNAVNTLKALEPKSTKNAPLDSEMKPSKAEEASYNRALEVAQTPLKVLEYLKDGTLQPQDVNLMKTLYPEYYNHVSAKIMDAMTDHLSKEETIPYRTRQTLSLFLGMPLDSTMKPESIASIQMTYLPKQAPPMPGVAPKTKTNKLGDIAKNSASSDQAREMRRNKA